SPPITNRGVTLYTDTDPASEPDGTNPDVSPAPQRIMGGYDGGVVVGFNGKWHTQTFAQLTERFEEARERSQKKRGGDPTIELDGFTFRMQPHGGGKGVYYRYILEAGGTQVLIHANPTDKIQPIRIRYGAEALIGQNLFAVHASFRGWLDAIGFEVEKEIVSRVDLQVMVERSVGEFFKLINSRRVITKAGKWATHGRYGDAETFSLGKDIQVCIYDKVREMEKMMVSEPVKFCRMVDCCFGGDEHFSQPVTRVEFRLRRDALKFHRINTIRDLQEIEPALVVWLTTLWFRLLSAPKKRGRENKQAVAPVWREVQERFREYFPGVDGVRREVVPRQKVALDCSADALLRQASGCLAAAMAILGIEGDAKQVGETAANEMRKHKERIHERLVERSAKMSIAANSLKRAG
ncbi:MAG: hypothetical protein ACRC46_06820, partial [Thermoguttaceae bacterium]